MKLLNGGEEYSFLIEAEVDGKHNLGVGHWMGFMQINRQNIVRKCGNK